MSLRRQGTPLFSAVLAFVAAAVVLQLWLLTVSMAALLSRAYPQSSGRLCGIALFSTIFRTPVR